MGGIFALVFLCGECMYYFTIGGNALEALYALYALVLPMGGCIGEVRGRGGRGVRSPWKGRLRFRKGGRISFPCSPPMQCFDLTKKKWLEEVSIGYMVIIISAMLLQVRISNFLQGVIIHSKIPETWWWSILARSKWLFLWLFCKMWWRASSFQQESANSKMIKIGKMLVIVLAIFHKLRWTAWIYPNSWTIIKICIFCWLWWMALLFLR